LQGPSNDAVSTHGAYSSVLPPGAREPKFAMPSRLGAFLNGDCEDGASCYLLEFLSGVPWLIGSLIPLNVPSTRPLSDLNHPDRTNHWNSHSAHPALPALVAVGHVEAGAADGVAGSAAVDGCAPG